jgi:F0F1-type ATP synthase membrane subunit a
MSTLQRGAVVFIGLVIFLGLCSWITFSALPAAGLGTALPVIVVPGEPWLEGWPSEGFYWTNTLMAMLLADIFVLIFIFFARRSSNNWTREVPGRFQAWVELLGGFMYDQSKSMAGKNARVIFPLIASIFVFLLAINWMKLLPGIESVGVMHCAGHSSPEIGITTTAGYPKLGDRLWVNSALNAGYDADEEDYHYCEEYKEGVIAKPDKTALDAAAGELTVREAEINTNSALTSDEREEALAAARLEVTESVWEHASVGLTPDELRSGIVPYLFVVTPYVRGGSTDLNLTLGLALISVVAIQAYGVYAQGGNYFTKFVNLPALGNLQKKPLGGIDFIVGLIEIISELGKIISLAFRLFGNMFAGGILLAVMSFLVAWLLPGIFIGLEVIVTTIQAYVFAVLTLVFSAQAMEGHHGDDEHHGEEHAEAHA